MGLNRKMGLNRTWAVLMALSIGSTGLAVAVTRGQGGRVALAAILLVAWFKAHLILKVYLGLERSPRILAGFDIMLTLTMIAMLGLALAG